MEVTQVPSTLFLIFTIAVVLSIIVQLFVFISLSMTVRKTIQKLETLAEQMGGKAIPLMTQAHGLVAELTPKINIISTNLADISTTVRSQTQHVNTTVGDVVDRTRVQAARVDDIVSAVLNGVVHAGATIQSGVNKPVRQVNGIMNGLRVGFETFLNTKTRRTATYERTPPVYTPRDEEFTTTVKDVYGTPKPLIREDEDTF